MGTSGKFQISRDGKILARFRLESGPASPNLTGRSNPRSPRNRAFRFGRCGVFEERREEDVELATLPFREFEQAALSRAVIRCSHAGQRRQRLGEAAKRRRASARKSSRSSSPSMVISTSAPCWPSRLGRSRVADRRVAAAEGVIARHPRSSGVRVRSSGKEPRPSRAPAARRLRRAGPARRERPTDLLRPALFPRAQETG